MSCSALHSAVTAAKQRVNCKAGTELWFKSGISILRLLDLDSLLLRS